MRKVVLCAAAALFAGGLVTVPPPSAEATLCGSVGGRFVDVTGCADPLSYLNELPPLPPAPNVNVCANVGRRISVSGCI
ncbi:RNA-binding protein [Mycobacterium sp. 1164985.4]|uniref:RNA-binding protein n=1 Tax=Mycobacterium sp. 1164985.4 TaxID=1834069 RepID=UPI00080098C2|nr:RNA-binding protein [Mycobacterium sp. 1164985.4]OBK75810.1 RNA-binding protein [Mycobacterium sp. 1164985.4]